MTSLSPPDDGPLGNAVRVDLVDPTVIMDAPSALPV
jgi:hypothetical protein